MAKSAKKKNINWAPLLMMSPALLIFIMVMLYPIIEGIRLSLFNIELLMPPGKEKFLGLGNYLRMWKNPDFWNSLRVTVSYTVAVVLMAFTAGMLTALLLNPKFMGRNLSRTLVILPWAIPEVVTVMIWRWMLDYQYGVLNFFIQLLGFSSKNMGWLTTPELAFFSVVIVTVWKQFPLATLVLLAGMQAIPIELYEAARIDGAGPFQEFRHVTLSGLRYVNIILILLLTLYSFKRVTLLYVMTAGGPSQATETLSIQTYLQAFKFFRIGYGSSIGTVMLCIMLLFSVIYFSLLSRNSE